MKKKVIAISIIVVLLLIAFFPDSDSNAYAADLGLNVSSGKILSHSDSHGGFHGDGLTYTVIRFSDNAVLSQIQASQNWKKYPLDDTVAALVHGATYVKGSTSFHYGPALVSNTGEPLLSAIKNGYYLLIDRHTEQDSSILERSSKNFSLGIYDTDTNTLHYCELDT